MTSKNLCPICHKESLPRFRPFCSQHCAQVDLGRWLNERYSIEETPLQAENEKLLSENSKTRLDQNDSIG